MRVNKLDKTSTPTNLVDKTNEIIDDYNEYTSTPYLPTAGGTVSGDLTVLSGGYINNGLTVVGGLDTTGNGTLTGNLTVSNVITGDNVVARGRFITASGIEFF